MSQLDLFDEARTMVRPTDEEPAHTASKLAVISNEEKRRMILRLLVKHGWLTQFCPFVLVPQVLFGGRRVHDPRYKQTAAGTRFAKLKRSGLIETIEKRPPRDGAETRAAVSTYRITEKGRLYLAQCDEERAS